MDTIFVVILFLIYSVLWAAKRRQLITGTGIDPEVLGRSKSKVQNYFYQLIRIMTILIIALTILHGINIQYYSMFSRFPLLDDPLFDIAGFLLGLTGLSICFIAQRQMKNSWRVGIDVKNRTELVMTGLFRFIRNPTYLGLYILFIGLWIIWPTWMITLFTIIFIIALEFQVRCEEDYLIQIHKDNYISYLGGTKRYIPKIY